MITYDYVGKKLKVGDYIIYPVRHGSSMWLEEGTIVSFSKESKYGYRHLYANIRKSNLKVVKFYSFDRCVKVA